MCRDTIKVVSYQGGYNDWRFLDLCAIKKEHKDQTN